MLCRALAAAATVTCMFISLPILTRTASVDQIKDLLCVLMLNGIGKEDLDGNTIRKLQHHNVNVDDLQNEFIRQGCAEIFGSQNSKNLEVFKTTTAKETKERNVNVESTKISVVPSDFAVAIMNYLKRQRITQIQDTTQPDIQPLDFERMFNLIKHYTNNNDKSSVEQGNSQESIVSSTTPKQIEIIDNLYEVQTYDSSTKIPFSSKLNDQNITAILNTFLSKMNTDKNKSEEIPQNAFYTTLMRRNFKNDSVELPKNNESNEKVLNFSKSLEKDKIDPSNKQNFTAKIIKEDKIQVGTNSSVTNIQPEIIRLIAEEVKKAVLKDLQHVIPETTSIATYTSIAIKTDKTTTKSLDYLESQRKIQEANHVIDKFLQLFQTLQQHQDIFRVTTPKTVPIETMKLHNSPYSLKPNLPLQQYSKPQIVSQQTIQKPTFIVQPISKITRLNPAQVPITIQTNSGEIAPLAIPINVKGKPEIMSKLIENQNIVVTTTQPFLNRNQRHEVRKKILSEFTMKRDRVRSNDKNINQSTERGSHLSSKVNLHSSYKRPKSHHETYYNSKENRQFRTRTPKSFDADYNKYRQKETHPRHSIYEDDYQYKKPNLGDRETYYEDLTRFNRKPINTYERHHPYRDYSKSKRNREILEDSRQKYRQLESHKREKYDNYYERKHKGRYSSDAQDTKSNYERETKVSNDSVDKDMSQRPLTPLSTKAKKYDDSHFKTFLKTQQKVNDMLESILSMNSKKPISIEVA